MEVRQEYLGAKTGYVHRQYVYNFCDRT